MLILKSNNKGQAPAIQQAIMYFLVVAIIMSMSIYFKRVIQARMRDVRLYMATEVKDQYDSDDYQGTGYFSYEPYYINQDATRTTHDTVTRKQYPTLDEDFRIEYDRSSTMDSWGNQLAPKYAD